MIKINNMSFKYKNKEILKDISINIDDGDFVAIVGQNGSGKSTLAKLLSGIERPFNGSIVIDEINTKDKNIEINLRKKIGIVFQNPENQILFNNVYDDIAFAIKNLKLDNIDLRINGALEKVNMKQYLQSNTYELSLGQKQRITIAGVLAVDTKYIIFDEPTTMIDSEGKEDIYKIIKNLNNLGYTIIYITNAIDEILMANKIIIINEGEIKGTFSKDNILDNLDLLKQNNIKAPKIVETIINLQKNNINIKLKEWTNEELIEKLIEVCKK